MAVNVSIESVLDEVVDQVLAELCPETGEPVTSDKPVYVAQRFMGSDTSAEEILKRVVAGRTPAVLVRHVGDRSIRTSIGRRVDRVESELSLIVCSDRQDGRDERKALLPITESVRTLVGARMYDQPMSPLRWTRTSTLHDTSALLALAVNFTTKHRVDYTIDPGEEVIELAAGEFVTGDLALQPTVEAQGLEGATAWAYRIDGIAADGERYTGIASRITNGVATLTGANFNRITWTADDRFVSYEVIRTEADGVPATLGTIGATALLTFDDTNLTPTSALLPEPYTQEIEVDLT